MAGGYYAVLWAIQGDLEFLASVIDIPRWSLKAGPCSLCRCTGDGDLSWCDFTPTANWLGTVWTPEAWKKWANRSKNLLFTLPGVTAMSIALDYMHVKYLGLDQYLFGSVLSLLCFFVLHGEPSQNLQTCWGFIQQYYKDHKVEIRYRYLNKLTMFMRKKKCPKLRGKACEIKYFGTVLLALWTRFMNPSISLHKKVLLMLKLNCRMEALINEHKATVSFPEEAAKEFQDAAFAMCALQQVCSKHFEEEGHTLFATTSKNHMLQHIAVLSKHINPRLCWCFTGEDMMHKCQTLLQTCIKGVKNPQATVKAASHYRVGLHSLFQKMD